MTLKHTPATPLTERLDCALATAAGPHSVTLNRLIAVECRNAASERDALRADRVKLVAALREVRLIAEAVDRAGDDAVPTAYRVKTLADAVEVANALLRSLGEDA